jgi:hypothetical protein
MMRREKSMRKAIVLAVALVTLASNVFAFEIKLDVPWLSQLDVRNGLGTDWARSMNCGPAALVMSAAYLCRFVPDSYHIKQVDDWLVDTGLIPELNQYNLPHPGTGQVELRNAAAYLYGLWDTRYLSAQLPGVSPQTSLDLIAYSLRLNRPVIVGVRSRMAPQGQHHWMVLTGLRDLDGDGEFDQVHVNDPGADPWSPYSRRWYPVWKFMWVWWGSIFFMDPDRNRPLETPFSHRLPWDAPKPLVPYPGNRAAGFKHFLPDHGFPGASEEYYQ